MITNLLGLELTIQTSVSIAMVLIVLIATLLIQTAVKEDSRTKQ